LSNPKSDASSEIFRLLPSLTVRSHRWQMLIESVPGLKIQILIRVVSRHRLEDHSRDIRVVIAARTVGDAIPKATGVVCEQGIVSRRATAMRFIFLNQRHTSMRSQRSLISLPKTRMQIARDRRALRITERPQDRRIIDAKRKEDDIPRARASCCELFSLLLRECLKIT